MEIKLTLTKIELNLVLDGLLKVGRRGKNRRKSDENTHKQKKRKS